MRDQPTGVPHHGDVESANADLPTHEAQPTVTDADVSWQLDAARGAAPRRLRALERRVIIESPSWLSQVATRKDQAEQARSRKKGGFSTAWIPEDVQPTTEFSLGLQRLRTSITFCKRSGLNGGRESHTQCISTGLRLHGPNCPSTGCDPASLVSECQGHLMFWLSVRVLQEGA
jgi:hypothetical protein